jgi:excisionase family DNA binding protein
MVMAPERFLTVEEVALRLRVAPAVVRSWLRAGRMSGLFLSRKAGYRITEEELERFIRDNTTGQPPA